LIEELALFARNTKSGFTLIELLIVVAIIAILAAIAVPNFLEAQTRAKVSRVKADIRSIVTAIEAYHVDNNSYPEGSDNPNNYDPAFVAYLGALAPGYYALRTRDADPTKVAGRDFYTLTTPISYISQMPLDPFAESFLTFAYRNAKTTKNGYVISSFGPDADLRSVEGGGDGKGTTNTNPLGTQADTKNPSRLGDLNERAVISVIEGDLPALESTFVPLLADLSYDPTNGSISDGDIIYVGPGKFTFGN
jgi:prepilin-type N-terminal cleavage/methylation domain-containing protein